MNAQDYLKLFRKIKIASAATVDEYGRPQSRVINVLLYTEEGIYLVASKGKPFYQQMKKTGWVAISAMGERNRALRLTGRVKIVDKQWIDRIFEENPGIREVYPGESRYILDAFLLYEGWGEFFDLGCYPIYRESFAFGGSPLEGIRFEITEKCIACGLCAEKCPQNQGALKCITMENGNYRIQTAHCLHCGLCIETCPVDAVSRIKLP